MSPQCILYMSSLFTLFSTSLSIWRLIPFIIWGELSSIIDLLTSSSLYFLVFWNSCYMDVELLDLISISIIALSKFLFLFHFALFCENLLVWCYKPHFFLFCCSIMLLQRSIVFFVFIPFYFCSFQGLSFFLTSLLEYNCFTMVC